MKNIGDVLGFKRDGKLYKEDDSFVSNIDAVGVEVEVENVRYFTKNNSDLDLPDIFSTWTPVEDGSLRNGTEFIFKEPYKGATISHSLNLLNDFFKKYTLNGKPAKVSERCSVHVHLDVRDFNDKELTNLTFIYMLFERVLFHHINPTRAKNNYCRPLTDSTFKQTLWKLLSYSTRDDDSKSLSDIFYIVKAECDKYSAFNVLPIAKYGSVEFRHHHGTLDMSEIKEWINIILALKNATRKYHVTDLLKLYEGEGAEVLMHTIFKDTSLQGAIHKDYFDILLHKGVNDINEIFSMDQLTNLSVAKNKSKVRPDNTLFHQFKIKNNYISPEKTKTTSKSDDLFDILSLGA